MISVFINEEKHSFDENSSLKKAIDSLEINQKGIAVAINNQIIQKNNWNSTKIEKNDKILIIKATQGG